MVPRTERVPERCGRTARFRALRRPITPPGQVLRKLEGFRNVGSTPDRQWRDVIGILRNQAGQLDLDYLTTIADEVGLTELLSEALAQV